MSTIDGLKTALAGGPGVLTCRWFDAIDEERYNAYLNGGVVGGKLVNGEIVGGTVYPGNSEGEVYLRLFVVWLNDDGTFSKEICNIGALDGAAYWERVPQLLRPAAEPSAFEQNLATWLESGVPAVVKRTRILELYPEIKYAKVAALIKLSTAPVTYKIGIYAVLTDESDNLIYGEITEGA